jgi:hypothetical protein
MNNLFVLIFLLPVCVSGQTKSELTKVYTIAITDFIKAAVKKNNKNFDTLYFGKRKTGEPDDFPDIQLPNTIERTVIKLISPEAGEKSQAQNSSRIYINLIGWVNKQKAEFIFVVFSNGFAHQYDYYINYAYNSAKKVFEIEKLKFKDQPK